MKKNYRKIKFIGAGILALLVISSITSIATFSFNKTIESEVNSIMGRNSLPYEGRLIVYVVEPVSRWDMYNGEPYHYACVDFAFDDDLSINYLDTYEDTIVWEGDVTVDNVMVMAAVFGPNVYQGYAYPPYSNPFDAYAVDAATGVHPGETGYNIVTEDFTHTVFAEEGTATWCPNCPDMANKLNNIYQSGDYPFYFVALVADELSVAYQHLVQDYNLYGYPTAFFDGGYKTLIGSGVPESSYRNAIENCGEREAHELNLTLSLTWLGAGDVQIDLSITNLDTTYPPEIPGQPDGPDSGRVGIEYTYEAMTTDPDGGDLFYWFDWDDGTNTGWIGPYESGEIASADHRWDEEGDYDVRVKVKDRANHETDWSDPLIVHIDPPEFVIGITGIFTGLRVSIMNNCDEAIPDVNWSILAKGGIIQGNACRGRPGKGPPVP